MSDLELSLSVLERLTGAIQKYSVRLYINKFSPGTFEGPIALDIEHDEKSEMVGIGLFNGFAAEYWTIITQDLKHFLERSLFIAHNGKTDFECLRLWGVDIKDEQLVWDTELFGHIIDSSRKSYGLKKLAKEDCGIEYPDYDEIVGKHKVKCKRDLSCICERVTLDKQPLEIVSAYNALDTFSTYKLYEHQRKALY